MSPEQKTWQIRFSNPSERNSYNIFFTGMPICWYCIFD